MRGRKHSDPSYYGTERIGAVLWRTAPPVMLALLIQSLYNIVDSFFVGRYSEAGLTALSVIAPIQWIVTALAVGTGVGVNTQMSRQYAGGREEKAQETAGTGVLLSLIMWLLFSVLSVILLPPFIRSSASDADAVAYGISYGMIVCVGSIGLFVESIFTKVHQAEGNMVLPMVAQVAGALCNVVLDPILIFGLGPIPEMGVAGAAYATICGQILAAVITGIGGFRRPPRLRTMIDAAKAIFHYGYPSILMQSLYTVYVVVLNLILAGFSDEAVTVLGLYYKIQTFFFIPLNGLQTCIVPIISYNYAATHYDRVRQTVRYAVGITAVFMALGTLCFELFPTELLGLFSRSEAVFSIGRTALRIIGLSFVPATFSFMMPVFFQAIGQGAPSVLLALSRQIFCLIPNFYGFSLLGLDYTWIAFPAAEIITGSIGIVLYLWQIRQWRRMFGYEG